MNHKQASEQLTGRNKDSRKLANNTYLQRRDGDKFAVKLHDTDVVTINPDGTYVLNSGGWQTMTTKARINEYAPGYIEQRKGVWYLSDGSLFYDGVTVDGAGQPVQAKDPAEYEKALAKIKKQARQYARDFVADAQANGLQAPSGGDCWYCSMFDRGTAPGNADHIRQHMSKDERYYVPSLYMNAIVDVGYANPAFIFQLSMDGKFWNMENLIYKYVVKRLQKELA